MSGGVLGDPSSVATVFGGGSFRYRVAEEWSGLSSGSKFIEVPAVATDSNDRAYVFNRGESPVSVFTPEGDFIGSWGDEAIKRAHGITIGPDDAVYCVDDLDHTVKKFSTNGELLLTIGVSGRFSDTGATSVDYREIRRAGPPFNFPTNLAISPSGDLYVTDGYGNSRVHRFSPAGELLSSWGEPGNGPGQFHVPHGIAVDENGMVFVADRENDRIQIFHPDGRFEAEWNDLARPCEVFIDGDSIFYVAELGYRSGMWPGVSAPTPTATGGRISVFDAGGELLARWGGGEDPCAPGDFYAPHDVWADSRGDLYVGEVTWSAGGNRGLVSPDCPSLQKFIRLPEEDRH